MITKRLEGRVFIKGTIDWHRLFHRGVAKSAQVRHSSALKGSPDDAGVLQNWDRWLRWVLVTPNMHSLHHSSYQPETDSNYGTVFTFWDRLFGTYRHAPLGGYDKLQIGLKEIRDQRASDLWWQLKSPVLSIEGASAVFSEDVR